MRSPGDGLSIAGPRRLRDHQILRAVGAGPSGRVVVPITDGRPGPVESVPGNVAGITGLTGVACSSASSCVAVGSFHALHQAASAVSLYDNGTLQSPSFTAQAVLLEDVACTTTTSCLAVSFDGKVVPISDESPGTAATVSGAPELLGSRARPSTGAWRSETRRKAPRRAR